MTSDIIAVIPTVLLAASGAYAGLSSILDLRERFAPRVEGIIEGWLNPPPPRCRATGIMRKTEDQKSRMPHFEAKNLPYAGIRGGDLVRTLLRPKDATVREGLKKGQCYADG